MSEVKEEKLKCIMKGRIKINKSNNKNLNKWNEEKFKKILKS